METIQYYSLCVLPTAGRPQYQVGWQPSITQFSPQCPISMRLPPQMHQNLHSHGGC